jgi:hypothetical protein
MLFGLTLAMAGCQARTNDDATWRSDCPPLDRPAPLSLEAAREAHRLADRRHELRLREAAAPGSFLREMHAALDPKRVAAGKICLAELADRGQQLFEHEYNFADGLGGGGSATAPGGPFRRVHAGLFGGPETISCPSCHWVGGPNGAGAETDNAFLQGDGDRTGSGDARNAPALVGLGVVQALAREMSRDLQKERDDLVREAVRAGAGREARLTTKSVDFGVLRATPKGEIDASGIRGVDADLVVKPFGWKGTTADFADFASEALQVHMGIQSDRLVATGSRELIGDGDDPADPDRDGVRGELGRGPFTAMMAHLALLEVPIVEPLIQDRQLPPAAHALLPPTTTSFADDFQRGREEFRTLGCAVCHVPMLILENPVVAVEGLPPIDLSREMRRPALTYDPALRGYPVWLFSDLKRHDMGPALATPAPQGTIPARMFLTRPLWGLSETAPYLHDGRAPTVHDAIVLHGGEATAARDAYLALDEPARGSVRVFLTSLSRQPKLFVP